MRIKIQKWGNSLALRIPKAFALEANVEQGVVVDLSVANGSLVAVRQDSEPNLNQLLSRVTVENLHGEQDFGEPVGREAW